MLGLKEAFNEFADRNSVIVTDDPSKKGSHWLAYKIKRILDGTLNQPEGIEKNIVGEYNFIKDKNKVISETLSDIKDVLLKYNFYSDDIKNRIKNIIKTYINNNYCTVEEIETLIEEALYKKLEKIINKIQQPGFGKSYHDLDYDLFENEQKLLAYFIKEGLVNDEQLSIIKETLKKGGDDLDYFMKEHFDENFMKKYTQLYRG